MQSQNLAVDPTHESDAQVSSELGQIITSRPLETAGLSHTAEVENTGQSNDIDDFFSRWQLINQGILQTTDTSYSDLLGSSFLPIDSYLQSAPVVKKTSNYFLWSGDVELMFTITAPSNAYGLYLLQAIPEHSLISTTYSVNCKTADNPYTATQGIHAFIDITTSNSVIFKLPFYSRFLKEKVPGSSNMWRVCLWCLSPIANAVGSNTIQATYNLYARMPNIELSVPYYQSKAGYASKLKRGMDTVKKFQQDKTISKTAGKIAAMAGMAATVPFLAPFAGPVAAGAAAVMSFAGALGFTRESAPDMPIDIHQRSFAPLANVDGKDGSEIVALMQSNAVTIDAAVGGALHEDEMSFGYLIPKWTIIGQYVWSTTNVPGDVLATIPVTPYFANSVLGAIYPTVAGFIGFPFTFWRGSMEYKVIIPASVYHRGMLQVYWVSDAGAVSGDPTQILLNEIFDVEAGSEYVFKVAWSDLRASLRNSGFQTTAHQDISNSNGQIVFRVVSALQAVGGAAPVTFCVLARGCDDLDFSFPRQFGTLVNGVGSAVPLSQIARFQGKNVGEDEEDESHSFDLVPNNTKNFDKISSATSGEKVQSVRALIQKFTCINRYYLATQYSYNAIIPHFWPPPFLFPTNIFTSLPGSGSQVYWSWYGHYLAMYNCVRGGTRYKLWQADPKSNGFAVSAFPLINQDAANSVTYINHTTDQGPGWTGETFHGMQQDGNNGVEFTLPNYSQHLWSNAVDYSWLFSGGTNDRLDGVAVANASDSGYQTRLYQAAAPDTSFFRFRRTPSLIGA